MSDDDIEWVSDMVANVALRGEAWWHQEDNSMRTALQNLPVAEPVKLWMADVAVQSWTEGAITAVQEYGDEMRSADEEFDRLWQADMAAVSAWRSSNPGNDLVLPDMTTLMRFLLSRSDRLAEAEKLAEALRMVVIDLCDCAEKAHSNQSPVGAETLWDFGSKVERALAAWGASK